MIAFTRTDAGYVVTNHPAVEEVMVSVPIPTMARTQDPQTGFWRVADGYARRVAEELRSLGFAVTGI